MEVAETLMRVVSVSDRSHQRVGNVQIIHKMKLTSQALSQRMGSWAA